MSNLREQVNKMIEAGTLDQELTKLLIETANKWLAINGSSVQVISKTEALEVANFVEKYFIQKEKTT